MKKVLIIVLFIFGIYMLVDHYDPMPLNHEMIGLGYNHMLHRVIGLIILAIAGYIWWIGRTKKTEVTKG